MTEVMNARSRRRGSLACLVGLLVREIFSGSKILNFWEGKFGDFLEARSEQGCPCFLVESLLDDFHQGFALIDGKGTPFSGLEVVENDWADGQTHEAFHAVANGLDHVADLTLFTGREDHRETARGETLDLIGFGFADFSEDAFFQLRNDAVLESMLRGDVVEFFDLMLGMGERLSEFAIVTEEE